MRSSVMWPAVLQTKLDTEKSMRHKVEARLLETEKKNSEMAVDLMQLQQHVGSLQTQLQTEVEKVSWALQFSLSCAENKVQWLLF